MTVTQIVYVAGAGTAFVVGLVVGEWERRTSNDPIDREALLAPAIMGLAFAILWPFVVGVALLVGFGLLARLAVSGLVTRLLPAHVRIPDRDLREGADR